VFGFLSSDAENGAVAVVARDYYDGGRQAGRLAARVMRGESPASIPFEPLTETRILVNPKAARAAGLTLPASLLERAAEVIGES
jgi:putative ABC transport system substrate-binding protein